MHGSRQPRSNPESGEKQRVPDQPLFHADSPPRPRRSPRTMGMLARPACVVRRQPRPRAAGRDCTRPGFRAVAPRIHRAKRPAALAYGYWLLGADHGRRAADPVGADDLGYSKEDGGPCGRSDNHDFSRRVRPGHEDDPEPVTVMLAASPALRGASFIYQRTPNLACSEAESRSRKIVRVPTASEFYPPPGPHARATPCQWTNDPAWRVFRGLAMASVPPVILTGLSCAPGARDRLSTGCAGVLNLAARHSAIRRG